MMLLRYKKTYEKIAMGLLSYMPGDRSAKQLQEAIHQYETNDDWQLYLVKKEDDIIGLIGIEVKDDAYILHHLSVNPSYRGEGVGHAMVSKLQSLFPAKKCLATKETESFIKKCTEKEEGAED